MIAPPTSVTTAFFTLLGCNTQRATPVVGGHALAGRALLGPVAHIHVVPRPQTDLGSLCSMLMDVPWERKCKHVDFPLPCRQEHSFVAVKHIGRREEIKYPGVNVLWGNAGISSMCLWTSSY
jgi:hypothetical protein